jgi:hypothetical protein
MMCGFGGGLSRPVLMGILSGMRVWLGSLIRSLFRLIVKEHIEVPDFSEIDKEELEKRRKRVLALCY